MRRLLPLFLACMLLACMLLASCAAPAPSASSGGAQSSPGHMAPSRLALNSPVYPVFPQLPQPPDNDSWDTYFEEMGAYDAALQELRGEALPRETAAALTAFAARSTPLALAGREGENGIFSPLSLWSALAMLAQCADGSSREQILAALGAEDLPALTGQVSRLWQRLCIDDGASALLLGNSIWLNNALEGTYVQETLDVLARDHYAGVYRVPMGTPIADQAVTDWVSEQTRGLIGGDSPVVQTDSATLALLASSLYYKAAWTDEFSADRTHEDTFTAADGSESRVAFMHRTLRDHFLRRDGYEAACLSTQLGEMIFVLPEEGRSPESLLADSAFLPALEPDSGDAIFGEVHWSVPRFDIASELSLSDALAAMGIEDILDPALADLSALTDLEACLSDARQLARVKVDEQGVEAAAVTILAAPTSAAPEPDPPVCIMDLDRPFLFLIRREHIPLFIGVVNAV